MASPYDYLQTRDPSAPMLPNTGEPQQQYAPSSSFVGNIRARTPGGGPAWLASSMLAPYAAVAGSAVHAFGGLHELKNGDFLKNLGDADSWTNFGSFGAFGARRAEDEAHMRMLAGQANWKDQASEKLRAWLGGIGTDVRTGVQPAVNKFVSHLGHHPEKLQQTIDQYLLNRSRAGQARQVDAQIADPRRLADQSRWLLASQQQQEGDLADQTHMATRNNAIQLARRGMQGSSVDVENQGQIGRERDQGAAGIAQNVEGQRQALNDNDQQSRSAMMGLIYANDPNTAKAFSAALQGIQLQGQAIGEQSNLNQQRRAQSSATGQSYGQTAGGLLSASAGPASYAISNGVGA